MAIGDRLYRDLGDTTVLVDTSGAVQTTNKRTRALEGVVSAEDAQTIYINPLTSSSGSGSGGDVNLIQLGGIAVSRGSGNIDAGTQRVTLAQDGATNTNIGATNETAPGTDTAASGLNGRLQRIAQRITAVITSLTDGSLIAGITQRNQTITSALVSGTSIVNTPIIDSVEAIGGSVNFQLNQIGTGGAVALQGSNDNSTWNTITVLSTSQNTGTSLSTTVNTVGAFEAHHSFRFIRLAVSTTGSGGNFQAVMNIKASAFPKNVVGNVSISASTSITPGVAATNLGKAEDAVAASGDTGVFALAVRNDGTAAVTSATGDYSQISVDAQGNQIISPYAAPTNLTRGVSAAITTTSSTQVIAAAGAGIRNNITSLQVLNSSATATIVNILDGATTVMSLFAAANSSQSIALNAPIRGAANTAINAQCVTTGANVIVSAQGFVATS